MSLYMTLEEREEIVRLIKTLVTHHTSISEEHFELHKTISLGVQILRSLAESNLAVADALTKLNNVVFNAQLRNPPCNNPNKRKLSDLEC